MALDEIRNIKIEKVNSLRKAGSDPYPAVSGREFSVADALKNYEDWKDKKTIVLAGRILAVRGHGGSTFFDISDGTGKIQAYIKEDAVGQDKYKEFQELLDIGDFLEVRGQLKDTKKLEKTIYLSEYNILTKALLPLPEKWHGLQDVEERLRKRYLDLIMNPGEGELFRKKALFWQATRQFLAKEGGVEVETPVLEQIPGGADAEPFITHMNALNIDLYLRIAPELSLKRLIVGGFDKVFEVGRVFRNEGIDREHLQDYTQMEMYWAYYDYTKLMDLVERLFKYVINESVGSLTHEWQDKTIDWSKPWEKIDYYEVFKRYTGLNLNKVEEQDLKDYAKKEGIDIAKHSGKGRLIDIIFKKKVRGNLVEPAFLILPPVDIEPLAKRWPKDPNRVERFQVVAGGTELGKGFSELNDPLDQRKRFEEQVKMGEAGDKEAQRMDEDFIEALEYGMPPTAGFGMSERFFSFLMNKTVRETVFFPLMRPKE